MLKENILSAVKKFGEPIFIYHGEKIEEQIANLKNVFTVPKLKINYACKALTTPAILQLIKKNKIGIDAVSIEEVKIAIHAGFKGEDIIFTPSGISDNEIDEVINYNTRINVDNVSTLKYISEKHPKTPVSIRMNPDILAGGNSNISVGHKDSKFGIPLQNIHEVLELSENNKIIIEGLHLHTGSDIIDIQVFLDGVKFLFDVAGYFKETLKFIDLGSGFKVPYKLDDKQTDLDLLGKNLSALFNKFCAKFGRELTLEFEPGKFLVSEAGYFVAQVNTVKETVHHKFLTLNTGFNHMIRPMFYGSYHHIENLTSTSMSQETYNLVGYLCETDTFAKNRRMTKTSKGDLLLFRNAGAYCASMASNYNSRLRPAEVLFYKNELHLIRERENFEQLIQNCSLLEL